MDWFNLGLGVLVGITLGSLVDCLAVRTETKESFWGRSYCDSCKKKIQWYDLFPIFSFLILQGRCRYCHKNITPEVVWVEVLMGLIIGILFLKESPLNFTSLSTYQVVNLVLDVVFKCFVICVLFILALIDLKTGLIPNRIVKPAIIVSLVYLAVYTSLSIWQTYQFLQSSPLGKYLLQPSVGYFQRHVVVDSYTFFGAIASALIIAVFFGGLMLITKGRGMGGGDFNLGIFIGLSLVYPNWLLAIILSFLSGSIAGIGLILIKKRNFGQTIPFGPFLSLGSIISILFGSEIINWYLTQFPKGSPF